MICSPSVELATLVKECFTDDWMHEIPFDGYRMVAIIEHGKSAKNW